MGRNIASANSNMFRTVQTGSSLADLPDTDFVPSLQIQDMEPGEYTIQFEANPPEDGNGFSAYAIISWKVDGQQLVRKMNVFSGASISGVAQAVDVRVVDVSNIGRTSLPPLPYKLQATLARGSRATTMQPVVLSTQPTVIFFNGPNSALFTIPQGAGVISCKVLSANADTSVVAPSNLETIARAVDSLGNTLQTWYPMANTEWIPLPGNAVQVYVEYFGTGKLLTNVIWGIEG